MLDYVDCELIILFNTVFNLTYTFIFVNFTTKPIMKNPLIIHII